MSNSKVIHLENLKPGDLLLYRLNEKPEFVKNNLKVNFGVLIDKLIIFASNPEDNPENYYTHAALVNSMEIEGGQVAESTFPRCVLRSPIVWEGYSIHVQRVPHEKDGSLVLQFLPDIFEKGENYKKNESYAMIQSVIAALACLLRLKVTKDNKLLNLALQFLKLFLYPLGKKLDTYVEKFQGTDRAWFCSQLAAYCYDMTAKKYGDTDYLIKCPSNTKIGETVLGYLISSNNSNLNYSSLQTNLSFYEDLTLESDDLIKAGKALTDRMQKKIRLYSVKNVSQNSINELSAISINFIEKIAKLFGINFDTNNIEQTLIDFQTAFIMPIDLVGTLDDLGTLE